MARSAAAPAAPAASRRVQPPRKARTDESREALRRRQLNLRPASDSDAASSSESEAPLSSSEVVGKYQGLVMEAMKKIKSGTASQIITQAQTLIDGEPPSTVRKSLSVALGILRRKGLLQLDGREYLLRKATTKKAKGRAPRGSVARKSHRPPLRDEDEDEDDEDEEKDDKKARRGSVASKSVPLTAKRAATQRLAQRRKKKTPAKKAAKKADPAPKKKKAAPAKKRAASAEVPEKKAPPKKKARTAAAAAPAASSPPAAAAAAPLEGAGTPADYHWEYHHKTWQRYAKEASDAVEEQYQAFLKDSNLMDVPAIRSGDWQYMVNFKDMTQTNIEHSAHTTRNIRRMPGP